MIHWFTIFFGILILSSSLSNPFFNLTINKVLYNNKLIKILTRILLFFIGIIVIFIGLYFESLS